MNQVAKKLSATSKMPEGIRPSAERLKQLRDELAQLEAMPWSNVRKWVAKAMPLIRQEWSSMAEDFQSITKEPHWPQLPRVGGFRGGYTSSINENNAAQERASSQYLASTAKETILSFLDGLLLQVPPDTEGANPSEAPTDSKTPRPLPSDDSIDVGIVFALDEEFTEFSNEVGDRWRPVRDPETGGYYYFFEHSRKPSGQQVRCVATFVGDMGPTQAGLLVKEVTQAHKPKTIIMLGIAAGISDDVKVGDVVIPNSVDAYIENSKAVAGKKEGAFKLELSGDVGKPSGDLVRLGQHFRFAHASTFAQWSELCSVNLKTIFLREEKSLAKLIATGLLREKVSLIVGHLASGPTVGSAEAFTSWLKNTRDRKYLALEMESAGLMAAVYREAKPRRSMILRGISDYGDERKKELDKVKSGGLRRYAVRNAISMLWAILDTEDFYITSV